MVRLDGPLVVWRRSAGLLRFGALSVLQMPAVVNLQTLFAVPIFTLANLTSHARLISLAYRSGGGLVAIDSQQQQCGGNLLKLHQKSSVY